MNYQCFLFMSCFSFMFHLFIFPIVGGCNHSFLSTSGKWNDTEFHFFSNQPISHSFIVKFDFSIQAAKFNSIFSNQITDCGANLMKEKRLIKLKAALNELNLFLFNLISCLICCFTSFFQTVREMKWCRTSFLSNSSFHSFFSCAIYFI